VAAAIEAQLGVIPLFLLTYFTCGPKPPPTAIGLYPSCHINLPYRRPGL